MSILVSGTGDWEGWQWETVSSDRKEEGEMVNMDIEDGSENITEKYEDSEISETAGTEDDRNVSECSLSGPGWRKTDLPDLENQLLNVKVEDEFMRKFQPGSLVWAKVTGHSDPAWPAKVTRVRERSGLELDYRVTFYGTKEWAELEEDELWPFTSGAEAKFCKPKFVTGSRKRRMFMEALRDIKLEQQKTGSSLPGLLRVIHRRKGSPQVRVSVINPAGLSLDVNSNFSKTVNRNTSK